MKQPVAGSDVNHDQIVTAIRAAESRTSGEIRVVVTRRKVDDPVAAAKVQFERLGMTATAARNGVLIFVAINSRTFAVIGDAGVHEKCGEGFWLELAAAMTERFRAGDLTGGIVLAIERAGTLLARHYPVQPGDRNELADDVEES